MEARTLGDSAARHGLDICDGAPRLPFVAFVVGTFVVGWLLGAASIYKLSTLNDTAGTALAGGWAYVAVMLVPLCTGILVTRVCARLAARGWGWPAVRWVVLGIVAAFAGFLTA